ncbi:hypothetical protein EDC04DRAFT_3096024 [Pisolithus marmoratus]|nr:hypothetical protein EDC04DRAFT_3096024 [Pisolithus marmoratus]
MEPELAEDGCNWHTYGSWVLKAISEEGLMGYLDGSETRPTTPKLLQEYGARWTPRTNEERDELAAWQAADDAWQQRTAMVHHIIISGIPDSILMLCMHVDTPHEAFAYLENRYGSIPRPKRLEVVDEAPQQHDMSSEQYMTGESAQSTCDSDNKPLDTPGVEEDPSDFPNDCAEIPTGHQELKMEIVDVRHVESKCTNAFEAPDKSGQCIQDDADVTRSYKPNGMDLDMSNGCTNKPSAIPDMDEQLIAINTSMTTHDLLCLQKVVIESRTKSDQSATYLIPLGFRSNS